VRLAWILFLLGAVMLVAFGCATTSRADLEMRCRTQGGTFIQHYSASGDTTHFSCVRSPVPVPRGGV
jgi:hypothetical protein